MTGADDNFSPGSMPRENDAHEAQAQQRLSSGTSLRLDDVPSGIAGFLIRFADFFYLPFIRPFIPRQTFRYAVCGGLNLLFSWIMFYIIYHYVLRDSNLDVGLLVISPHIATMGIVFVITLVSGFYLNRTVAFRRSPLRGRVQLMRYTLSTLGSLAINYTLLKIFVDACGFYPTPSQILSTGFVTVYSYMMQKYFTFRGCEEL